MSKRNNSHGFVLIEALAAVVIASICLTAIAQSLINNFRATSHFQEGVYSILMMENELGRVLSLGPDTGRVSGVASGLNSKEDKHQLQVDIATRNEHLKNAKIILSWPSGKKTRSFETTTILYNSDDVKTRTYAL